MDPLIILLKEVKDKWGRETVTAIINKLKLYPVFYKGTLQRSIMYQQDQSADGDISFLMADYGRFIDEGVNGKIVSHKSPYSFRKGVGGIAYHIKPWAKAKGLNEWAVATNIWKFGITPRPFFNSVIAARVPMLEKMIEESIKLYLEERINDINNEGK